MLDSQLFQRWDSFPEGKNTQINVFILWFYQLFPSFSCAEEKGKENSSATEASPLGERCSSEDASIHKGQREPRRYKHTHKWGWGRTGSRKKKPNNKKSSFFTTHYYGTKRILMHFQQGIESPPVSALCLLAVQECQRAPSSGCQNQSVAKRHKTDITGV